MPKKSPGDWLHIGPKEHRHYFELLVRSHAVLVVRTHKGDVVLDNMTSRILPWKRTGYAFLKMQNPEQPAKWDAIWAGGVLSKRS